MSRLLGQSAPNSPFWEEIPAARMPKPYRGLLVHNSDMTSTLEGFHGETLGLRLLDRRHADGQLWRKVVLVGTVTGRPVELGAIRIDLEAFAPEPRRAILASRTPLGSILASFEVAYLSRPRYFFRIESDTQMERELDVATSPMMLYGRRNVLSDPAGRTLADVVEILPPSPAPGPRRR